MTRSGGGAPGRKPVIERLWVVFAALYADRNWSATGVWFTRTPQTGKGKRTSPALFNWMRVWILTATEQVRFIPIWGVAFLRKCQWFEADQGPLGPAQREFGKPKRFFRPLLTMPNSAAKSRGTSLIKWQRLQLTGPPDVFYSLGAKSGA